MKTYSFINEKESIEEKEKFQIIMPGGWSTLEKDWYPFVMTFNADEEFSSWHGEKVRLTILYNFPAFSFRDGASKLYDVDSPYYNSFYGAYLVQKESGIFGFSKEGQICEKEIAAVPEFDFLNLVLDDFGLERKNQVFEETITKITEQVELAGYKNWTRIEANILVNGSYHKKKEFVRSYLQYGSPKKKSSNDETYFEPVDMKGIIYVRYFPEYKTSVFLYAVCREDLVLEKCEEQFLKQTIIRKNR